MSESLATYIHDHLAGAAFAIDLVEFMRDQHRDDDLGQFLANILVEIQRDRDTLRQIAGRVGGSGSTVKETASWVAEKVSRFKLGHDAGNGLALFEALEFLTIGILGKRALWTALAAIAPSYPRLAGVDFKRLAARAQKQQEMVDERRLIAARAALRPPMQPGNAVATDAYNEETSTHSHGGLIMRKSTVAGSVAITVGVLLAVALLPDFIRYMKIRAM